MLLSICLLAGVPVAYAEHEPLDCRRRSLADAVERAGERDRTILFTGVCRGPIVIRNDGLTLKGVGPAVIDGESQDAVTIAGASGVSLINFEVRNGMNGIVGRNGAHFTLTDVNSDDNRLSGISLQNASSAIVSGVTTDRNGLHGLELQTGSAATVSGSFATSANRVFGLNVNASSISFSRATVSATGNALGIQISTNAQAFVSDSATVINANNNLSTGLTVVSGAHMFVFGGTVNASGNPVNGVSVNSRSGLDLDAASSINSSNNGNGLLLQQGSVMTIFNTPQFSGAPGFSTLTASNNTLTGVRVLNGATLTLVNQAMLTSRQNGTTGFVADNGSGVTLVNSTITENTAGDMQLTFGVRADFRTLTFGNYACDATVLVRGTSGIVCPN
jgi:hypothetical protein